MGRIADNAQSNVPASWDMLSKDSRVGDPILAVREAYIVALIFGTTLTTTEEDALDDLVVEYAGKRLAIEIIRQAIDLTQHISELESTQQPVEMTRFPERLKHLKEQLAQLIGEVASLEAIVAPLIPNILARRSRSAPLLSSIDQELLTPNPEDLGAPYAPLETG